jgi:integrase
MRGSPYYQSAELIRCIFSPGLKKEERSDPNCPSYKMISSYESAATYRRVFENIMHYLHEEWKIKDIEKVEEHHLLAYLEYKVEYYPTRNYLEKIVSAIGKLEFALNRFNKIKGAIKKGYDFSKRLGMLKIYRNLDLLADNYHNRAYPDPDLLTQTLSNPIHALAAKIQYEGGTRIEGVGLIKVNQLQDMVYDPITKTEKYSILTKEKGGKEGSVLVQKETYEELSSYIQENGVFKINRQSYYVDLRNAADLLKFPREASHGLRWNFAQRRLMEYAKAGYTYEQSLQGVSWEMKHNRANITQHYLGG